MYMYVFLHISFPTLTPYPSHPHQYLCLDLCTLFFTLFGLCECHIWTSTVYAGLFGPPGATKLDHVSTGTTLPTVSQLAHLTHTAASPLRSRDWLVCNLVFEELLKHTSNKRSGCCLRWGTPELLTPGGVLISEVSEYKNMVFRTEKGGVLFQGVLIQVVSLYLAIGFSRPTHHGVFLWLLLPGGHPRSSSLAERDPRQFDESPHAGGNQSGLLIIISKLVVTLHLHMIPIHCLRVPSRSL